MTVGTAERNRSPSWFKICTDYEKASDNAVIKQSPEFQTCTPAHQGDFYKDKGVIL
jgi:hypothetical protein